MPYTPIYLTLSDAQTELQNILWCWTDVNGALQTSYILDDLQAIEGEVSAFLYPRYDLPVTDTVSVQLVRSYVIVLLRARGYNRHPVAETPESIMQEARQTRGALRDLNTGAMVLGGAAQKTTGTRVETFGQAGGNTARFTQTSLGAWG